MNVVQIDSLEDPRVADYRNVQDGDLRRQRGLFMAEGRFVVEMLLSHSRHRAKSIFTTPAALEQLRFPEDGSADSLPIYLAPQAIFSEIVGFRLHRGCLAVGKVAAPVDPASLITPARAACPSTLVVLEGLTNTENVGAIFRNAMAFGVDAVLLCPRCCDPLYRKAVRVSMGGTLRVPYARASDWPAPLAELRAAGYRVLALDPAPGSVALDALDQHLGVDESVAWVLGTEGPGLSDEALERVDLRVRIPMADAVDSVNVATATGIALQAIYAWRLRVGAGA
jgi:tRNA G18 (ribose-2'-O)-methylase SpoU